MCIRDSDQGDFHVVMVQDNEEHRTEEGFFSEYFVDRDEWIQCDEPAHFEIFSKEWESVELIGRSSDSFIPDQTNGFELVVDEVMCDDPLSRSAPLEIKTDGIWGLIKVEVSSASYPKEADDVRFRGDTDNTGIDIRCNWLNSKRRRY